MLQKTLFLRGEQWHYPATIRGSVLVTRDVAQRRRGAVRPELAAPEPDVLYKARTFTTRVTASVQTKTIWLVASQYDARYHYYEFQKCKITAKFTLTCIQNTSGCRLWVCRPHASLDTRFKCLFQRKWRWRIYWQTLDTTILTSDRYEHANFIRRVTLPDKCLKV